MVNKEVILAKIAHIEKSLDRLKQKQGVTLDKFSSDRDTQDIVLLNLQTSIQGCIDIASHIVSDNKWGVPASLAGLFDILYKKKVITQETHKVMRLMTGFRNLIVHEYAELDTKMVYDVFNNKLGDFGIFLKEVARYAKL